MCICRAYIPSDLFDMQVNLKILYYSTIKETKFGDCGFGNPKTHSNFIVMFMSADLFAIKIQL